MEAYEITLGTILKRKELRGIKGGGSVTHAGTPSGGILDPLSVVSPVQIPCSQSVTCTPSCTCGSGATLVAC